MRHMMLRLGRTVTIASQTGNMIARLLWFPVGLLGRDCIISAIMWRALRLAAGLVVSAGCLSLHVLLHINHFNV